MTTPPSKPRFHIEIMEQVTAAALVALLTSSTGGVLWLVVQLPNRLEQMEQSIGRILDNQKQFETKFGALEDTVHDHDKRIIKLELTR